MRSFLILAALVGGLYFAWHSRDLLSGHPGTKAADRRHFEKADQAFERGWQWVQRYQTGTAPLPPGDLAQMCGEFDDAARHAESVSTDFLKKIHPDMPRHYRDDYLGAMRRLATSLRAKDRANLLVAAQQLTNFLTWTRQHTSLKIRPLDSPRTEAR
jgi:hypothetical protein